MTWWEWLLAAIVTIWTLVELGRMAVALEGIRDSSQLSAKKLSEMEDHQRQWQLDQEQQG